MMREDREKARESSRLIDRSTEARSLRYTEWAGQSQQSGYIP